MNEVQYYNDIRLNYIDDINDLLILGYRSKAILSFKYDHLNFVINTMQILIIFISAALTLMESIKTYYNTENEAIDITAILFTSFIGIIMTLYRFLKLENKKERTGNILENYNLILNKLQRVKNTMENMIIKSDNTEDWAIISNTYTNEILGTYISIKEAYDNNFSYKEAIYYKTKYGRFLLQEKFVGNELKTIYRYRDEPHVEFKYNRLMAMIKGRKFNYNKFIEKYDKPNPEVKKKRKDKRKKSNQQLYFDYLARDDKQNAEYLKKYNKATGGVEVDYTSSSEEVAPQNVSQTGIPMSVMGSNSLSPRPKSPRNPGTLKKSSAVIMSQFDKNSRFEFFRRRNSKDLEEGYDSEVLTEPPLSCEESDFEGGNDIYRNSPTPEDLKAMEGSVQETANENKNAEVTIEVTEKPKPNKKILEL